MQIPIVHIDIDEEGIPRTINQRVKVNMIALKYNNGVTPEEIAAHYGITLADVYAALAYFHDNLPYFEERSRQAQELLEQHAIDGAAFRAEIEERLRKIRGE